LPYLAKKNHFSNIERLTVNTGRIIQRRYQLHHVIEQGIVCAIYQGYDEVLHRNVVIKIVPTEHIPAYRAAIRATRQFAHPNITCLFDLVVEPDALYIVQEQIKGDNFGTLLRSNLTPLEVTELGMQICRALIYTGTPAHKICHGDLTPSSIIRSPDGHVYVNNFALPSDIQYFTAWSVVGGGGFVLSDPELPYGQMTEGRRSDDTRAVGLLLYQLLAGRPADATKVEPPGDGRLRFQRIAPPELCDVIARAIVRMHPQRIATAESLYTELKNVAEALEAMQVAEVAAFPHEDVPPLQQFSPVQAPFPQPRPAVQTGQLVSTLPSRDPALIQREDASRTTADAPLLAAMPSPVSNMSMKLAATRQAAYASLPQTAASSRRVNVTAIIMIGLVLFAVFFGIGFYIAHAIFQ
jgi:serine/threonine protein kinase